MTLMVVTPVVLRHTGPHSKRVSSHPHRYLRSWIWLIRDFTVDFDGRDAGRLEAHRATLEEGVIAPLSLIHI